VKRARGGRLQRIDPAREARRLVWRAVAALVVLGLALVGLLLLGMQLPLGAWLANGTETLRAGDPGAIAGFVAVHVVCVLAFVPVTPIVFMAGFLWGTVGGALVITAGNLLGPTLAFLLGRSTLRARVHQQLSRHRYGRAVERAMALGGFRAIVLLRLSPIVPMAPLNYALSLFPLDLGTYVLATTAGLLPITLLYTWGGAGIDDVAMLASGNVGVHSGLERGLFWAGLAATFLAVWWLERLARRSLREIDAEAEALDDEVDADDELDADALPRDDLGPLV
jgi:uncharacterized membrane protein YdjX (TVP38/TMEM64 family)